MFNTKEAIRIANHNISHATTDGFVSNTELCYIVAKEIDITKEDYEELERVMAGVISAFYKSVGDFINVPVLEATFWPDGTSCEMCGEETGIHVISCQRCARRAHSGTRSECGDFTNHGWNRKPGKESLWWCRDCLILTDFETVVLPDEKGRQ